MTITFFELLGLVIEREIDFIADHLNKSVDEIYELIVEEAERNQAEWYSNRVPNLNYQYPACRLAYLYIVAAANSSTFQYVLESDQDLNQYVLGIAKERHEVKICAFGAGPGTELLAMAKFFAQQNLGHSISVDFQLLDRVEEWTSSWYGIRDQINDSFRKLYGTNRSTWPMIPSGNFLACDVTQLDRLPYLGNVWGQDVYVINFLLSEVFNDDPGLRAFLSKVAEFAPSGARFVFIERRGFMWQNRMANIAAESGLLLSPFIKSQGRLEEDPIALGQVYNVLLDRRQPRLTWDVVYSIGIKQ
ncbi:hypothetical protein [Nodularia chucula]|uniref:hypothetical protein n=1 Tax=Nodularia chucula TaxID=3093667 RepID=UPI0039C65227